MKGNIPMESDKNSEIIDFDALFEEKKPGLKPESKPESNLKISKLRSFSLIGIYFLITIVVATLIQVSMILTETGTRDITASESMVEQVSLSTYGLGYLDEITFLQYHDDYPNVVILTKSNGYVFIANSENPHINQVYTIQDIINFYQSDRPLWKDTIVLDPVVKLFLFEDHQSFVDKFGIELSDQVDYTIPQAYVNFTSNTTSVLNFVIYLLLAAALIPVAFKMYHFEFGLYFPRKTWIKDVVLGYGMMFVASAIATVVVQLISIIFNYMPGEAVNQQAISASLLSEYGFLIIIVTIVFAPLLEELIFRKAFFSLFKKEYFALVFSSLIFGLIHVVGETSVLGFLTNWITYSASGFALGYIYIKNNHNIWSSILIHAVYNAVAVVLMLFVL